MSQIATSGSPSADRRGTPRQSHLFDRYPSFRSACLRLAALPPWLEVDEIWLPVGGERRPVALVAAMHKLLVMLNAIMRDQVPRPREPVTKSIHT